MIVKIDKSTVFEHVNGLYHTEMGWAATIPQIQR